MTDVRCHIWDTLAAIHRDSEGDLACLDSPRAGGKYKIAGSAIPMLRKLDIGEKARLTTWLCNRRRAGVEWPTVTSDVLNSVKSFRPLSTTERIERALLFFNDILRVGGSLIILQDSDDDKDYRGGFRLAALTESRDQQELLSFLAVLANMGLLADYGHTMGYVRYAPSATGWLKIDDLVSRLPSITQAFVAMWFNVATHAAYTEGIEPAIFDSGYQPVRIDKKEHNNKIDDEIIAEIRRSKFLVADFTCEKDKVRGGVYFEAGFAMGLGVPVIWTVQKSSLNDVHFDTRQYNHIVWDTPETLRSLLRARTGAVIGDGPLIGR